MISPVNLTILILWFISASIDYAEFCYIWQLKEYRWDRFRDFLSTKQGGSYWTRYPMLWRSLAAIIILLWPINSVPTIKYALIAFFCADIISQIWRLARGRIVLPVRTNKAFVLITIAMFLEGGLFVLSRDWAILFLLIIIRFFLFTAVVFVFQYPTRWLKTYYVRKATSKISRQILTVIGITGSYGKTSVKEFLFHILSAKYRVAKTPRNVNTEIGVAQFILSHDFSHDDIFIVEMGAYAVGEIQLICDMVKPKIGILTAINEQHLALFGSMENIQQAKYELLRALPQDGLAVANSDNAYCREYLSELASPVATFGSDEQFFPDCLITDVDQTLSRLCCSFRLKGENATVCMSMLGEHQCTNIAPCILVALHLDMTIADITERAQSLKPIDQKLKLFTYGACIVIDDSYNSNPEGFRSALHLLGSFPSDYHRMVVTRGMIELGGKSDDIHERIGGEIAYCADELILVSREAEQAFRKGIGSKFHTTVGVIEDRGKLLKYIRSRFEEKCVILLENRIPESIHEELTKERSLQKLKNIQQ